MTAEAPERLIDPDGEGIYFRSWPPVDDDFSLLTAALEFFGDTRRWRDLDSEFIWMREGEDGNWYRDRWRRRYTLLPESRCPVVAYSYITPNPEAV